jgi:hypothetical protein
LRLAREAPALLRRATGALAAELGALRRPHAVTLLLHVAQGAAVRQQFLAIVRGRAPSDFAGARAAQACTLSAWFFKTCSVGVEAPFQTWVKRLCVLMSCCTTSHILQ